MCPECRRHLVEIAVRVAEATLTMHACSTCDRSWWDRNGEPVELGAVLALTAAGVAEHPVDHPSGGSADPG